MPFPLAISTRSIAFLLQTISFFRSFTGSSSASSSHRLLKQLSKEKEPVNIPSPEKTDQPALSNMVQIEMRPNVVLLHFDAFASIGILLDDLQSVVQALQEQIRPKARSLFHIRLCFASRIIHPSFLRLVRSYIEEETHLKVRGISCSKEAMQCILRAATGLDIHEAEAKSQIMHQTFRSGMMYSVEGELLIYGDVHEGAQVQATGSITVMGVLAGMAHAGCSGDRKARIYASSMMNPKLWIDAKLLSADAIENKRGYSVASLPINKEINSSIGGDYE